MDASLSSHNLKLQRRQVWQRNKLAAAQPTITSSKNKKAVAEGGSQNGLLKEETFNKLNGAGEGWARGVGGAGGGAAAGVSFMFGGGTKATVSPGKNGEGTRPVGFMASKNNTQVNQQQKPIIHYQMEPKLNNGHAQQQQPGAGGKNSPDSAEDSKLGVPHNEGRRMSAAAVFWSAGQQASLDSSEQPHRDVNRAAGLSQQRPVLSTHVLDIGTGRPAHGLHCKAFKWDRSHSEWTQIGDTVTNAQGRIPAVHTTCPLSRGTYKLRFSVKEYFGRHQLKTLFPHIDVVVDVDDACQHLHIPVQLTPYGYSIYKGC